MRKKPKDSHELSPNNRVIIKYCTLKSQNNGLERESSWERN